ncbi:TetR family transcriptional regulator [Comamonas testosteroni]|uniref:TetR family transcriptional regulator n=1 Tax=Comamonas testosteroni TaxID=285 RepID=A0A373FSL9_COMTE|nr:TetR family transcriptional regulator [Comamonas testosteroni]RGE47128.1 TetR family transcriptional regulator [Comamonas testosteroni]
MSVARDEGLAPATIGLREQKKRDTQQLLVATGMRLFLEQGYTETTLDQIAAEAGVSRRTFFSYFPSKDAILVAASDAGWDEILGDIAKISPQDSSPLQAVCECLLARLAKRSNDDLVAMRRLMLLSATLRSRGQTVFLEREYAIAQLLAQIWPEPERQWENRLAAMAAVGAFRLAVDIWRDGPEEQSLQALTEQSFAQLSQLLRITPEK